MITRWLQCHNQNQMSVGQYPGRFCSLAVLSALNFYFLTFVQDLTASSSSFTRWQLYSPTNHGFRKFTSARCWKIVATYLNVKQRQVNGGPVLWTKGFMRIKQQTSDIKWVWFYKDCRSLPHFYVPYCPFLLSNPRQLALFFQSDLQSLCFFSVTLPLFFSSVEGSQRRRKWIWWVLTNAWANGWNVNMLPVITHARLKAVLKPEIGSQNCQQ